MEWLLLWIKSKYKGFPGLLRHVDSLVLLDCKDHRKALFIFVFVHSEITQRGQDFRMPQKINQDFLSIDLVIRKKPDD